MEYPGSGGFGDPGILARVGTYPRGVRNRVFSRVSHPFWTTFQTPNMACGSLGALRTPRRHPLI